MGLFDFLFNVKNNLQNNDTATKTKEPGTTPIKTNEEGNDVADVNYYVDNLMKICKPNPDYNLTKNAILKKNICNTSIYQYTASSDNVKLIPEANNPSNPKAIKVIVDDLLVGYIKKGSCGHIHNLLKSDSIMKIQATMSCGKRKCLTTSGNGELVLENREAPMWCI